jgi:hypothetical protein
MWSRRLDGWTSGWLYSQLKAWTSEQLDIWTSGHQDGLYEQLDIWTSGLQDGLMVVLLLVVKMAIWLFC